MMFDFLSASELSKIPCSHVAPTFVLFFNPFISRLCASSACVTRCFPLLWLTTLVSSGATTCVFGLLHQYWCQHTSVPSVQSQAPEANALIHKVEWTRLFGLMDVTYRTREKRSHYIYVGGFLNALVGGPSHCWLWLQFAICFALFSNIIHVLKWAKSSLNPEFSLDQSNRGLSSSVSISL